MEAPGTERTDTAQDESAVLMRMRALLLPHESAGMTCASCASCPQDRPSGGPQHKAEHFFVGGTINSTRKKTHAPPPYFGMASPGSLPPIMLGSVGSWFGDCWGTTGENKIRSDKSTVALSDRARPNTDVEQGVDCLSGGMQHQQGGKVWHAR